MIITVTDKEIRDQLIIGIGDCFPNHSTAKEHCRFEVITHEGKSIAYGSDAQIRFIAPEATDVDGE